MLRDEFILYLHKIYLLCISSFSRRTTMHIPTDMELVHKVLPAYARGPGSGTQDFELTSFTCLTRVCMVDSRLGSSLRRSSIF